MTTIHRSRWADLPARTAYDVLRLRVDVFVVEQRCAYPELDGRDLEDDAWHLVAQEDEVVLGCLRVLTEPAGGARIGRVCVAPTGRGRGVAADLMHAAHDLTGDAVVVVDAQAHLRAWYARLGYVAVSSEFLDDGIPHVTMRRRP